MDNINIKICEVCGFQTDNGKIMSNHKRWKHIFPKGSKKYLETIKKLSEKSKKFLPKEAQCPECGKKFISNYMDHGQYKKYCSAFCANKQGSKYVDYKKISEFQKKHGSWKRNFINNGIGNRKNHSKRELEIVFLLKEKFPNDEWKQGFVKKYRFNGCFISPDLHSDKLKIVIEYDGIWHFKDINNQLKRKQEVDKETMAYCKKYGYRIIRIDEKEKISNEQIIDAVYNRTDSVVLFGNRYGYLDE